MQISCILSFVLSQVVTVLLIALSAHSHFNSHWTFHARIVQRVEFTDLNKVNLEELRNEYEECRYNRRVYLGYSLSKDSPEVISGFGTREYSSSVEKTCPNPILELFLVCVSICVLIMSLISTLIICELFPKLVTRDALRPLRIVDMILFGLASIFLFVGMVMFWYSTYHISEWCELKWTLYDFKPPPAKGKVKIQHDDTVDIITGQEDVSPSPGGGGELRLVHPSDEPDNVFYLSRLKRDLDSDSQLIYDDNDNANFNVGKIREDEYLDLCHMRQLTTEKYWTVAVAFISTFLHGVTVGLIYKSWRKARVNDASRNAEAETEQRRRSSTRSNDSSLNEVEIQPIIKNKIRPGTPQGNAKRISFDEKAVGSSTQLG